VIEINTVYLPFLQCYNQISPYPLGTYSPMPKSIQEITFFLPPATLTFSFRPFLPPDTTDIGVKMDAITKHK